MKSRAACIAFAVVSFLLGRGQAAAQISEGGKTVQSQQESSVLKNLEAPSRPDRPWTAPELRAISAPLREERPPELDADKEYELAELIDVAERSNPLTKVAWARAKEAASAVGLAKSEYYPVLALKAAGTWVDVPVPLP